MTSSKKKEKPKLKAKKPPQKTNTSCPRNREVQKAELLYLRKARRSPSKSQKWVEKRFAKARVHPEPGVDSNGQRYFS